jgi:hypothetical protein
MHHGYTAANDEYAGCHMSVGVVAGLRARVSECA